MILFNFKICIFLISLDFINETFLAKLISWFVDVQTFDNRI